MLRHKLIFIGLIWLTTLSSWSQATTIKVALDSEPVSLDPHEQLSEGALLYSHTVFDSLVRWQQDGTFEPRLATSWQVLSDTSLQLSLRKNVVFHSGNTFTANDVAYTLERLKRSTDFKALFNVISHSEVVDDHTIIIHTRYPFPLLLNILAYVFAIDSDYYDGRDSIVKFGHSFASNNESGTGPFVVMERVPGEKIVFQRNPNYWDTETKGNVDTLELLPIRSDSTRLAALLTGDVDIISPIASIDIPRVNELRDVQLVNLPGTRIIMLQLNQERRPELSDLRVRRAMSLAINQALIVNKVLRGYGKEAGQLSASFFLGHIPNLEPKYDIEQAKQLMKEAGYSEGFNLSMMAPNNRYMSDEQIAQAVVAMLEKINIRVDFKTMPKAQYFQLYDQRAADVMMLGWQSDTQDSNNIFEFTVACRNIGSGLGVYNASGYCNPVVDQLITQANQTMNLEKRQAVMQAIEEQVMNDVAIIPLHWQNRIWASKKELNLPDVLNIQNNPYFGDLVVQEP
ncbi:ABC transporter substrate-binding protein [Vibrio sp. RC27]